MQGHGITVQGGGERGDGPRNAQQDGGDGAAKDGGAVDRGQKGQAGGGVHGEGDRDHQGDGHVTRQAGERADDKAHYGPDKQEQKFLLLFQ